MDVLQASEDLVEEVAHMVIAQVLCLEQLVQVCLHQGLDDVPGGRLRTPTSTGSGLVHASHGMSHIGGGRWGREDTHPSFQQGLEAGVCPEYQ